MSFGIALIAIGTIFFITPQILLYKLLSDYKKGLLNILRSLYELNFLRFIYSENSEEKAIYVKENKELETAIEYAEKLRTLPFSTNNLLKLGGTIFIWLQTGILQLLKFFF